MKNLYSQIASVASLIVLAIFAFISSPMTVTYAANLTGQEQAVIDYTNNIRGQAGLVDLIVDSRLMISSYNKANDMAEKGYFSHANPEGYRMSHWINGTGYYYSLAGENLAKGFNSVDNLMQAWVDSSSHYSNLVEDDFVNIGVGIATRFVEGQEVVFVVQHFGQEKDSIASSLVIASDDITKAASLNIVPSLAANNFVPLIDLGFIGEQNSTVMSLTELKLEDTSSERDKPFNWLMAMLAIMSLGIIGYTIDLVSLDKMKNYVASKKIFRPLGLR